MVFITIAGHKLPIEIDTGASISLLNWETFQKINCESNSLLQTKSKLKTYSGEIVSPKGKSDMKFTYEGNKIRTTFLITGERSPNVLGRDILGKLWLNCKNIFHSFAAFEVVSTSDNVALNKIIFDYKVVFFWRIGNTKRLSSRYPSRSPVTPKYFCARPVLYSLKEKIEHKLERLVKLGIYCPVAGSRWAVPIVPVFKGDGSSCICGDYKQTVNKAADCDKYRIPKVEDVFATLNWGEKFTKLDLSQAYQQLLLSLHSRELLTINLHKRLFQPTRLQFGVHSAPGIFQRELENRLASIPYVKVPSDHSLISGKNDIEHFNNLRKVLKVIYDNGLHLKLQKCVLMQDEVVYVGFKINKNGLFPVKEKIVAIKNAEESKNISELKSFLGLLDYYHRHFQGFADTLEPLHNLRKGVKWE